MSVSDRTNDGERQSGRLRPEDGFDRLQQEILRHERDLTVFFERTPNPSPQLKDRIKEALRAESRALRSARTRGFVRRFANVAAVAAVLLAAFIGVRWVTGGSAGLRQTSALHRPTVAVPEDLDLFAESLSNVLSDEDPELADLQQQVNMLEENASAVAPEATDESTSLESTRREDLLAGRTRTERPPTDQQAVSPVNGELS